MAVLLIAEVAGGELNVDATAKALTAVAGLGDVTVLCASAGCGCAAEAANWLACPRCFAPTTRHTATIWPNLWPT